MKVLDKKVGNVVYYKYRVNLPVKIVEETGLLDKEVQVKANKGKIIIEEKANL